MAWPLHVPHRMVVYALCIIYTLSSVFWFPTTMALRPPKVMSTSGSKNSSIFRQWYRHWPDDANAEEELIIQRGGILSKLVAQNRGAVVKAPYTEQSYNLKNNDVLEPHLRSPSRRHIATCPHQLRRLVFDQRIPLRDIQVVITSSKKEPTPNSVVGGTFVKNKETLADQNHETQNQHHNHTQGLQQDHQHQVLQLIARRYREKSKPSRRAKNDQARLALSLEGGGMRGSVSAGMAAAIAYLGLQDVFDCVYGSSAGSCIGAYLVSRQLFENRDIYSEILTSARRQFVCRYRLIRAVLASLVDLFCGKVIMKPLNFAQTLSPGMNLSYVLDEVMDSTAGLRPLNLEAFLRNNLRQPLRIVSSYVHSQNGTLAARCFGTSEFISAVCPRTRDESNDSSSSNRGGIYACLKASMTVPGAAGPPVKITTPDGTHSYFDAFCFEPMPYRSAVEEGASHVLVLCTRPACFQPRTKPTLYEKTIAPLYFQSHGDLATAKFFASGGQQYLYAEDLLTLEEGRKEGMNASSEGVLVPPPRIFFGVEDGRVPTEAERRSEWKRAHLLPVKIPAGTPELATLEQDKAQVLEAVRAGFATAYNMLAPITVGGKARSGQEVARLVFPDTIYIPDRSSIRTKHQCIPVKVPA